MADALMPGIRKAAKSLRRDLTRAPFQREIKEEQLAQELEAMERELKRREYVGPDGAVLWAKDRLGAFLWSKQREILESVRVNRKTAVKSCHGPGKSFTAALAVAWWIDTHKPGDARVVTTAPTGHQVKAILWHEIGRAFAKGHLQGRVTQTQWHMTMLSGREEMVAFGRKPADLNFSAFQGIHALDLLAIFDEACGMAKPLWIGAESLLTNERGRFLAIGNPDDPTTEFAEVCKPGSGWNVITIPAFCTPNFTGERSPRALRDVLVQRMWVEEHRKKWAPGWRWGGEMTATGWSTVVPPDDVNPNDEKALASSADPMWFSKVFAQFPLKGGPQSLIPIAWIESAMERSLPPGDPVELGVDVGAGGDSSTVCKRRGPVFRIVHEDHNPDTMQTMGNVVACRYAAQKEARGGSVEVKVDKIGIGAGIVDRSVETGANFVGINVGMAARDPERFANLKAENWWGVRERFETGDIDIDPNDALLVAELTSLRYKRNSRGQILIESKEEAKRRGIASPNRAEALMLAACVPPSDEADRTAGLLW